jgi:hypothetical protein
MREDRMRAVHILRSLPELFYVKSKEWELFWLVLGANTAIATLAWLLVGLFFD